jgi:hypothetical protein
MKTLTFRTPDNHEFTINTHKEYEFENKKVVSLDETHLCFLADLLEYNQDHMKMIMDSLAEAMSLINVDILDSGLSEPERKKVIGTLIGLGSAYKQFQKIT